MSGGMITADVSGKAEVVLTTKGDIATFDTARVRKGVSATNYTGIQADSTIADGLTYGATARSTMTGTADILYSSAANTLSRLAVGTARQVLQTNSATTAPEWSASPQSLMDDTGQILYSSSANTLAKLDAATNGDTLQLAAGVPAWVTVAAAGGAWTSLETQTDGSALTIGAAGGSLFSSYRFIQVIGQYRGGASDAMKIQFYDSSATVTTYDLIYSFISGTAVSSPLWYYSDDISEVYIGYTENDNPVFFDIKFPVAPADSTAARGQIQWKSCASANALTTLLTGVGWVNSANDLTGFTLSYGDIADGSCSYEVLGLA